MKYLLDTNVCIQFLNRRSERLLDRLVNTSDDEIAVCSIVRAEMLFGSAKSRDPARSANIQRLFLDRYVSLPFDDHAAEHYAGIRAALEISGQPIGAYDLLIAAIALAHDLIVVTHNVGHFSRVPGLRIEDWEAEP